MTEKNYKCKLCKKSITLDKAIKHLKWRHPIAYMIVRLAGEDKMGKLIIHDGKLVDASTVQNEQVLEQKQEKIFKKEEAAPMSEMVEAPKVEAQMEEEHKERVDSYNKMVQQQQQQPNVLDDIAQPSGINRSQEEFAMQDYGQQQAPLQQTIEPVQQATPQQVNEEYTQHNGQAAYLQHQEEAKRQHDYALQQEYDRQQAAEAKVVEFNILLNNGTTVDFNIPVQDADNFYKHVEQIIMSEKILKIENKMIPGKSITMVSFH